VRLDYDGASRLTGEDKLNSQGVPALSYLSGVTYNSAGEALGASLGNTHSEAYGYAPDRLQLTSQTVTPQGSTSLMSLTYNYKATTAGRFGVGTNTGNTGQLLDISAGSIAGQSRTENFNYDNVGRLSTAQGWSTWQRRYSFDRWGNRLGVWNATSGGTQIQSTALSSPSGYPATNQYTSITNNGTILNQSYDFSGNLSGDGVHNYIYDGEGRLVTVDQGLGTEADYVYDANNWRVKRTTGAAATTTYYVWSAGQVIAEYSNATPTATASIMYYHPDQLSTRLITDGSATVVGTEDVMPFGEDPGNPPLGTSGAGLSDKHRFTNYERDAETGVDYAMNRHYVSSNGRFMQPDVISGSIGDPQSLNRYSYSLNDPKNLSDPSGLQYVDGGDGPPPGWAPPGPWGVFWSPYNWTPDQGYLVPPTETLTWGPPDEFQSFLINSAMSAYSQNTVLPLPENFGASISARLRRGGCGDFTQRLIDQVAKDTNRPFYSDFLPDIVDAINNTGGGYIQQQNLTLAGVGRAGGTAQGAFGHGALNPPTVVLDAQSYVQGSSSSWVGILLANYVLEAIHETIHLSGANGQYSDQELATAAFNLGGLSQAQITMYNNIQGDVIRASTFWNGVLAQNCP
jgi:RHS repeat-associated protein